MGNICIFSSINLNGSKKIKVINDENYFKNVTIVSTIGSGKFGEVFEVYDSKIKSKIALKKVENNNYQTQAELSYMKYLKDKSIIKCHQIITDSKFTYFLLDLYNCDLFSYFENNILLFKNEKFIKIIIKNILKPLLYLKSNKLVHLDIKPENYLVKNDCLDLVLTDLSTIKSLDKCKISSTKLYYLENSCGTLNYAAPEIFINRYSEKSDIFSLGQIIYMFYTKNFLPCYKSELFNKSDKIIKESDMPTKVKTFILKCRKIHVKDRFSYNDIQRSKWLYD